MPVTHAVLRDPEDAHKLAIFMGKLGVLPKDRVIDDSVLSVKIWGKEVSNPIGLAAGCDKHGEAIDNMLATGFGFVEIGSVTPQPQPGNPRPRFFRLKEDGAVINRYGFNSEGHDAVASRLKARIRTYLYKNAVTPDPVQLESYGPSSALPQSTTRSLISRKLLGVNLGKNKTSKAEDDQDFVNGVKSLGPLADYIVVNISSPNTPGLRALQRREPLEKLLKSVKGTRDDVLVHKPPLLVKIAPDVGEEELKDIAAVCQNVGIDGVIISNTTITRPETLKSPKSLTREFGGLSGAPLFPLALNTLRSFYSLTNGSIPLIGCGGIRSADEAIAFAKAGATLVQLYTSYGMEGPGVVSDTKDEVTRRLKESGKTWMDIVGEDHRK
ncbi:Dihydroorotate dehydrogenase (quinone), mitochondrial [Nowakowskiella sp. JEL0407]|nr:Dihydroorotate dehydrogenase (quinone), mitochondrial [Nowakowskiella sp. JEL0407]